jgi:hypothetical protein
VASLPAQNHYKRYKIKTHAILNTFYYTLWAGIISLKANKSSPRNPHHNTLSLPSAGCTHFFHTKTTSMPPMRLPISRLSQAIRSFSSVAPGTLGPRQQQLYLHRHILQHGPSQRILSKASAASHRWTQVPEAVRDVTSYLALGALSSQAAFLIYCWVSNISSYRTPSPFQPTPWIERCDF